MSIKLRIGIAGTRGIPNNYGGFECFAEHLSQGLVSRGHEVYVYNPHNHPNQQPIWSGVHIIHCYDPEYRLGSTGQFIYDFNCVIDSRKRNFDILLFLGYTSSSVWGRLYPAGAIIISNMDGFEWKRSKYSKPVQQFLKYAEKLAVRFSHFLVADSTYIQTYLNNKYNVLPEYIAYGANVFTHPDEQVLDQYQLLPQSYNMLMARMEPENNIEMILDGFHASASPLQFIVVGNTSNKFGQYLVNKFAADKRIRFLGAIFNQQHINNLIFFSSLYFHGHSVGGTNPSLLEAMSCQALIVAQDNVFNKAVLKTNAYYFNTAADIVQLTETLTKDAGNRPKLLANIASIQQHYSWHKITGEYESFFIRCWHEKKATLKTKMADSLL